MSTPIAARTSRRSVARWTVAAIATGALVVSGSGLVAFAQTGTGESQGPSFVPADASAYLEARLDRPGGQGEALAQMMTAFPGFADPGSFDLKVDELLGGVTAQLGASMPDGASLTDVFTGEVGLGLADLDAAMMDGTPSILIGLAVADAEAGVAAMESLVAGNDEPMTESTYNDVAIFTDGSSSPPMSVAMHDGWMVIGTGEEQVQASIDVLDGAASGLADDPDFASSWARLPDARLGAAWLDFAPFTSLLEVATSAAGAQTGISLSPDELAALLPKDMVASVAAETDRLNLEILVSPAEGQPLRTEVMGESDISMSFPGDTQIYLEMRDVGNGFEALIAQLLATLEAQEAAGGGDMDLGDIEALIGEGSPVTAMLGAPLPEFLSFISDLGIGAGLSSDGLWLGIAGVDLSDPETATARVTSLLTILRMALLSGEQEGMGIETNDVAGVEVTTITLPVDQMVAEQGLPISVGNTIDVALTDDQLLIGFGDFVPNALAGDSATSLGASAGYTDALGDDTVNAGVTYVDIGSLIEALGPMLAMMSPEWESIAPFADGMDRVIVVPTIDDEVSRARLSVIVGQ